MTDKMRPLCQHGETEMYVDADGQVYPCCWIVHPCHQRNSVETQLYPRDESVNLNHHTLEEVTQSDLWQRLMTMVRNPKLAPPTCLQKCGPGVNNDGRPTRVMYEVDE